MIDRYSCILAVLITAIVSLWKRCNCCVRDGNGCFHQRGFLSTNNPLSKLVDGFDLFAMMCGMTLFHTDFAIKIAVITVVKFFHSYALTLSGIDI